MLASVSPTGEDVSVEVCDVRSVCPQEEPEVGLPQGLCLDESW